MKLSIIIPVYNGEKYLQQCLDSVVEAVGAQALDADEAEVIVVDDGSTDSTPVICHRYAADHKNVKVIHRPNGGLSVARNTGIDHAAGDYLAFVDADDMLRPGALAQMMRIANDNNADVVCADFVRDVAPPRWAKFPDICSWRVRIVDCTEAVADTLYQRRLNSSACGKLFKRNLFEVVRFRPGLWYEDLDIIYRLYEATTGPIVVTDAVVYYYRDNPASFINVFDRRRLDVLTVTADIEDYYRRQYAIGRPDALTLLRAAGERCFSAACNMFALTSREGMADEADRCWQIIKRYRWSSLTGPRVRLKSRLGALICCLGRRPMLWASRLIYD